MLIFKNSRSQIFFKIGVLKNFAIFTGKHWSPWGPSFTELLRWLLLDFRDSKFLLSAESGIYCWQPHWFLLRTSLKQELNLGSSHWNCYVKKGVLRNFANFIGKHLCRSLFLIGLQAFRPAALSKRDSNTDVFLWNLQNFWEHLIWGLRTTASETCSFTWAALFNKSHIWLKLIHML